LSLTSAYLLVSHGSRDPRPQVALDRLAYLVDQKLVTRKISRVNHRGIFSPQNLTEGTTALLCEPERINVRTATLECHPLPLHQQIIEAAYLNQVSGFSRLKIVPLFLLPGVHVQVDLPAEVAIAQSQLGNAIPLELCPYLGSSSQILEILAKKFNSDPSEVRIIFAHGSRRVGGNTVIESLANQLNAIACYWSVSPGLESVISQLDQEKTRKITILPYFLFSGGITDAIATQVQQYQQKFPKISFKIGSPLGATPELAQLILDLVTP
jgi:sirohydrochlorin cobaltochelatase